tara:strand:- start:5574 stop:6260 length:687 start_codon:yes stop_codon:yes gene_type:complete
MADFSKAVNLICKYEGYNEKAYEDPSTGKEPYTFGYGTQYYPDGSPVKQGHRCTKEKALEYLFYEVNLIDDEIDKLHLNLHHGMKQALISFIHSIGWEPFLYSDIVDLIENEEFYKAAEQMNQWIFDYEHKAIPYLLERRKEEIDLFLSVLENQGALPRGILLTAVRSYTGSPDQIKAINNLEDKITSYLLAEFINNFEIKNRDLNATILSLEDYQTVRDRYDYIFDR